MHDWYYAHRDAAALERIETNFKLRQRALADCLDDALNGKPLSKLVVRALREGVDDVISGYYNQLLSPVNIGRGAQGLHKVENTMIRTAVSYIALCKSGVFSRKNHIKIVYDSYGVSRSTVQGWYDDDMFAECRAEPFLFSSQDVAENAIQAAGEMYKNNKKARKKA